MKEPRLDAFDPKAQPPPLQSPLTGLPRIEKPTVPDRQPPPGPGADALRPPAAPKSAKRKVKKRHGVDIYVDQIERLRQYAAEDLSRGGRGSQSKLVRDALDDYIRRRDQSDK